MELTKQEQELLAQLENRFLKSTFNPEVTNDFVRIYDSWLESTFSLLPEEVRDKFLKSMDQWLVYIQVAIQHSQKQEEQIERIINQAKVFDISIEQLPDFKNLSIEKLQYLADKQINLHKIYSFIQGGLSGSGNPLLLGVDIPMMLIINLRTIQSIAACYGYHFDKPLETMIALRVFHCATLPKRFQPEAWQTLYQEIHELENQYFYKGNDQVVNLPWLNSLFSQLLKAMVISIFSSKKENSISLFTVALGAGVNYSITNRITEAANHFYQYRFLFEKNNMK